MKTMVDQKMIKRFSDGIYYIPRKTIFGDLRLDVDKIISKKYLTNKDEVYGYIAGITLLNSLSLTTQVPNRITIVTNKESSRGRKILIGKQEVYITKSRIEVTRENYPVLQLLEIIRLIVPEELDEIESNNLLNFIINNAITLKKVSQYCVYYPDYVSKRILGGKLIEILTR
ncbi:MAG: DUF6088 family protein [Thomasclavelia sp.]